MRLDLLSQAQDAAAQPAPGASKTHRPQHECGAFIIEKVKAPPLVRFGGEGRGLWSVPAAFRRQEVRCGPLRGG
jgi:hypothetical protein